MSTTLSTEFNHLAPPYLSDPYPLYARAQREAPVFFSPIFYTFIVTRYDDVMAVLRDPARFSSADSLTPPKELPAPVLEILKEDYTGVYPLVASDPPAHTRLRALCSKAFLPQRIAALEPRLRELASGLIDRFAADRSADLMQRFAGALPMAVTAEMFGIPIEDMARIKAFCAEEMLFLTQQVPLERLIQCSREVVAYRRYLRGLVLARRESPGADLISSLITARLDGERELGTDEIIALLGVLIFAAHETTTNMLGNTVLQLLRRPELWQALKADPGLIPGAVEEGLRFDSPIQAMMRTATCEVELGGVTIPTGSRVLMMFGAANRDPAVFTDPDRFELQRENAKEHLALGRGIHFCIGAPLARLEGRLALELLTQRLPGLRLASDEPPPYLPNFIHRGPHALPIVWD